MHRCWLLAAALACAAWGASRPAQAADHFYIYDSVFFGIWGDGWWQGADLCPPWGAEQALCLAPDNSCGAMSLPAVCYAFSDLPDSCRDNAYPAGDWNVDLFVTGPDTIGVTAAVVAAACDTLCEGIVQYGSASVVIPPGQCVHVSLVIPAGAIDLGASRRVGLRLSHENPEFRSSLCWGDICRSGFAAPSGSLCGTAIGRSSWGAVKARFR